MLNFSRNDRPSDHGKDPKLAQRAATQPPAAPAPATAPRIPVPPLAAEPAPVPAAATAANAGSRLFVGPNINLKGVEISNCDALVIEGNVEATIDSKTMEIAAPGRLNGTAAIDVAEVHGEFTGELTAREKLVVHSTGRLTGTIHYGKLVVAEGGTINGELKQLEAATKPAPAAAQSTSGTATAARAPLAPQPN